MYLPGFESNLDYARSLIDKQYQEDKSAWVIAYSGGKDSTLLLQLVCEVCDKYKWSKPVFVIYNDTGIDLDGKKTRINFVFNKLEKYGINTEILVPDYSFWYFVIGLGYPMPSFNFRYCTSYLKQFQTWRFEKSKRDKYGSEITFQGVRKEESVQRNRRLTKNGAPESLTKRIKDCFIFNPIADVKTNELWEYLDKVGTFYWGESINDLKKLYPANTVQQRDGCWCCSFASENSFKQKETTPEQDSVRQYLRVINEDCSKRCLCSTEKQKKRLASGVAAGRFTLEARKEIFEYIDSVYPETLSEQDRILIPKCWNYFSGGGYCKDVYL